jgi:hypothetical protein
MVHCFKPSSACPLYSGERTFSDVIAMSPLRAISEHRFDLLADFVVLPVGQTFVSALNVYAKVKNQTSLMRSKLVFQQAESGNTWEARFLNRDFCRG